MTRSDHEKLEGIFNAALEKASAEERKAFLDEACQGDDRLRAQVVQLLETHGEVGSFLDAPPTDPKATIASPPPSEPKGMKIGPYKILQEIGEGGFGTVYMADQEEPVRRKVALKIIKLGMDTKQVIARFEAERQALALMNHPNIARVLDAGATDTGRPYFVMELVPGATITDYCDRNKLSVTERLRLFLPVCHAVQHAHQKGIIHRDLKPNNVLITMRDSRPVPKVIDFGIAKATSQRLTDKTLFTEFRQFLGTPEYMSPDQLDTSGLDVDTRSDVYSLGVLLYELLTGTTPFDAQTLHKAPYEVIQRTIREEDPPTPSARLQTTQNGDIVAKLRQSEPLNLSRQIRGDLDWIVMKALEKDRTRRYQTAIDLAEDVERHLRFEPVEAGPPSAPYRIRKFIRRHRVAVLASSIVAVSLLVALALTTASLIVATRAGAREKLQRELAEKRAEEARIEVEKSKTVSRFLREMLAAVDPTRVLGREVTVRFVLDEAGRRIDEGMLAGQPEVEADVRVTLGETYEALGLYSDAETHLKEAVFLLSRDRQEAPETLHARRSLASVLRAAGKFSESEELLRRTVEIQERVSGKEDPATLATWHQLALALWGPGRYQEAEGIHRSTLRIQRRVLGTEHEDTVASIVYLGEVCRILGKTEEAGRLLQEALEASRRVLREEHPLATTAMNYLAQWLEDQSNYAEAESLYQRTYEIDRRVLGPDHPQTQIPMNNLLRVLNAQGKVEATRPLVLERIARLRRSAERPDADALALYAYAWELLNCEPIDLRDGKTALPVAQRAVERDGGRDADMLETLARAYEVTGDLDRAIETQRRAIARARTGGPYDRMELEAKLTDLLVKKGDLAGAMAVSFDDLAARIGESFLSESVPGASLIARSQMLMEEESYDEAASLLQASLTLQEKELPAGHWRIADTRSQLGAAIAAGGGYEEAEPLLHEGCQALANDATVPVAHRRQAIERLVSLYRAWGKAEEEAEWARRLEALPATEKPGKP